MNKMGYTKRRVDYYDSNPPAQTLLKKLLQLEERIITLEEYVNNIIREKGVR